MVVACQAKFKEPQEASEKIFAVLIFEKTEVSHLEAPPAARAGRQEAAVVKLVAKIVVVTDIDHYLTIVIGTTKTIIVSTTTNTTVITRIMTTTDTIMANMMTAMSRMTVAL